MIEPILKAKWRKNKHTLIDDREAQRNLLFFVFNSVDKALERTSPLSGCTEMSTITCARGMVLGFHYCLIHTPTLYSIIFISVQIFSCRFCKNGKLKRLADKERQMKNECARAIAWGSRRRRKVTRETEQEWTDDVVVATMVSDRLPLLPHMAKPKHIAALSS